MSSPLSDARSQLRAVKVVLCDLDDTLTLEGRLPSASLAAMERLEVAGIATVVVTGRPAGWSDMIARMWPVSAVVGENGAFYFRYDRSTAKMLRRFQRDDAARARDQARLREIVAAIQAKHPQARLSADQAFRISDYAIDICEDVEPLPQAVVDDIVAMFEANGATAKVSSIHVNAWIGDFSKLQMSRLLLEEHFGLPPDQAAKHAIYVGDSPNDEPMFAAFPMSVGVANVRRFLPRMTAHPTWITTAEGGVGFAELVDAILSNA